MALQMFSKGTSSVSSEDLAYSMTTVVGFQIWYAWKLKRLDLKWYRHKRDYYVKSDRCISKLGCVMI